MMKTTQDAIDSLQPITEQAREGVQVAKRSMLQTLTGAASLIAKGVSATTMLMTVLRKLDRDDGLAWFGLSRRRNPLVSIGIFGAGAATGATLALLFAPTSGLKLRQKLFESLPSALARTATDGDLETANPTSSDKRADKVSSVRGVSKANAGPSNGERAKV
jgi:hypothetical protein